MQRVEIGGRVVREACGRGLARARVELATVEHDELERRSRADAEGNFVFVFRGAAAELAKSNLKKLSLRVTDDAGQVLASCVPPRIGHDVVEIALDDEQIKAAGLRIMEQRTLLRDDFAPTLNAAVARLDSADRPGALAIIDRLTCGLPPLLVDPDLLDLARGVLRGRVEDLIRFRETLRRAEVWSTARNVAPPRRNAEEIDALMQSLRKAPPHQHGKLAPDPRRMIDPSDRVLLVVAAGVAAPDEASFVENVELVYGQLELGERLSDLMSAAWDALDGRPQSFRAHLGVFGGCWPPGGAAFPFPPDGDFPIPWPLPFPFPWPVPQPRPPGTIRECDAEAVRALREALDRTIQYTIESVEPPNACPGTTITIRGTNLRFEGESGGVWFSSGRRDMPILATPTFASDTEIRVVVPDGARCGPLELDLPAGAQLIACGTMVELFHGPTEPFEFHGGETFIKRFSHAGGGCPRVNDRIRFSWELCNATEHELRLVQREGGHVQVVTPPRASTASYYDHILPRGELDYELEATLTARGPCGEDSATIRFGVQREYRRGGASPFAADRFENWHGNVNRPVRSTSPTSLQELVEAVLAAEREGARVGVRGSGWSYSDCVVPPGTTRMIDTSALNRRLFHLLPDVLADSITPVFPAALQTELTAAVGPPPSVASRLIHVEAGIKIHELNRLLDLLPTPLAMPTLGGSNGQSIAGAISTGTHGSNPNMPPIPDFVRALHLVGPGGQQWWIEPSSRPITNRAEMEARRARGQIDPCTKLVYDDDLFFSCLVSMGCAGVIYAVVVEAVQAHRLTSTTTPPMPWIAARSAVQAMLASPAVPTPWFAEIVVNGSRTAWLTTRAPVAAPAPPAEDPCAAPDNTLRDALLAFLFGAGALAGPAGIIGFGTGAIATVMGAIPFYVMRRIAELAPQPWRWGELQEEIELIEDLMDAMRGIMEAIREGTEEAFAEAIPEIFNVLWRIGFYVIDGRTIVEQAQNMFTTFEQRPPGTRIRKSYTAMTGQCDVTLPTYRPPAEHSAFERLIESYEFGVPASQTIAFVEDLLSAAGRIRRTNDALILNIAIRFTTATGALLGMQQAPRTGHVELYTVRGLNGNRAMHAEIDRIARAHGAWPHWGQFHEALTDYSALYPGLPRWRAAMDRIALESARDAGGSPNTFRQGFALARGLLSPL